MLVEEWKAFRERRRRFRAGRTIVRACEGGDELRLADEARRTAADAGSIHASEGGATTAPSAATPVGALLANHVLRDGEVVQLMLKPSLWFIPLSSLTFIISISILIVLFAINRDRLQYQSYVYIEAFVFLLAGRLMFATLQWFGHLYILTDYRIVRITGIFSTEIFDCALRKVGGAELTYTVKERLVGVGTIVITPGDCEVAPTTWQMVRRPRVVHETVVAAIAKARQGG